jgi:hypothetical protein
MRAFRIILERMSLQTSNDLLLSRGDWAKVPNWSIIQYTRENPKDSKKGLADRFNWIRMIRPSGGGNPEDEFSEIERKQYTNEELLAEAEKNRNTKTNKETDRYIG